MLWKVLYYSVSVKVVLRIHFKSCGLSIHVKVEGSNGS